MSFKTTMLPEKMKPLLCSASVVRNLLNSEVGAWPARAIDSSKPFQWQDRRPIKRQRGHTLPEIAANPENGWEYYADPNVLDRIRNEDLPPLPWPIENTEDGFAPVVPPIKVGNVLYVRESVWTPPFITDRMMRDGADTWPECFYTASMDIINDVTWAKVMNWKSRPSIHMPRKLSRIHLEVMRVRVERACDITAEDAMAEGCNAMEFDLKFHPRTRVTQSVKQHFQWLWTSLYGPDAWEKWVWVMDLKRIK